MSRKRTAAQPMASEGTNIVTTRDAAAALSAGDAPSMAVFFRGLMPPTAIRAGPQHVCLKRAFALLENRWKMDAAERGREEPPVAFGESVLAPELFVGVVAFLDPHQAMRSAQTCKDWWRNVSTLPAAAHIDHTTLRLRRSTTYHESAWGGVAREVVTGGSGLGWNDLLTHLRHIKKTNPRRFVRRLTLSGGKKLGSLSNLSSATAGLLTHIDFSRTRRDIDFDQLGINFPGLRGLGVKGRFYSASSSQVWVKSLAKLMTTVSLESLRVSATQSQYPSGDICQLNDAALVAFAGAGDCLLRLTLLAGAPQGADVEEGLATLGAATPRLEVLTTDQLRATNNGWKSFATARLSSKRRLTSIRIKPAADAYFPCKAVRALLLEAVTESLVLFGKAPASASSPTVVDCEGSPVAVSEAPRGKLRVTSTGPWGSMLSQKATDL